ncbi:MAG: response regulator [Spirochaetales bacterium]|nr:response regulator [Spirochaetales bacterium]
MKRYCAVLVLWAVICICALYLSSHSRQREDHRNSLLWLGNELEHNLSAPGVIAERLSVQPALVKALESGGDGTCQSIFTAAADTSNLDYVYLLDSTGLVIAANVSPTGIDLTGNNYGFRPYFTKALAGEPQVDSALGVTTKAGGIYYSVPVLPQSGTVPLGVLVISLKDYNTRFSVLPPSGDSVYLLVSPEGVIMYDSAGRWNYTIAAEYRMRGIGTLQYGERDLPFNPENLHEGFRLVNGDFSFVSSSQLSGLPFRIVVITPFVLMGGLPPVLVVQIVLVAFAFFAFTILSMELGKRIRENKVQQRRLRVRLSWERGIAEASRTLIASSKIEEDIELSFQVLKDFWNLEMITFVQDPKADVSACYNLSVGEVRPDQSSSLVHIPVAVCNADQVYGQLIFYCEESSPVPRESGAMELLETYARVFGTVIGRQQNIHSLLKLERELQMSHKMEAIGTLAGGIAHDFNNVLAAIRGSVDLSLLSLDEPEVIEKNLGIIRQASERAAEFVGQILTFSRQKTGHKTPVVLDEVVEEFMPLIRGAIHPAIEIIRTGSCGSQSIMGDKPQLGQLLLNVCTNSAHAIGNASGVLSISCASRNLTKPVETFDGEIPAGNYSVLRVKDTGKGMPREVLKRVFEPFFTTKENAGTGLGLAVVHGVVKSHGGYITITSALGSGTEVAVYFPEHGSLSRVHTRPGHTRMLERKKGKVLLVEDETPLADLGCRILEKLGYDPVAFTDPLEALSEFPYFHHECTAAVIDYYMPGMNGVDLSRELRKIDAGLPVILTSGYVNDELYEVPWVDSVLFKPYNTEELDAVLRTRGRITSALNR